MKARKILVLGLALVMVLALLAGCGGAAKPADTASAPADTVKPADAAKPADDKAAAKPAGKKKMVLICKTLSNPFFVTMSEAAKKEAVAKGVELSAMGPEQETEVEKQVQMVENAIVSKVDAILLTPAGSKELTGAIKKANDAKIPVIIIDTKIDKKSLEDSGAKTDTFMGSDNYQAGQIAADFVGKAVVKGEIAVLEGVGGQESGESRKAGFTDTIKKNYPDIKIVASQTASWDKAQGYSVTQNILQAHPNIKAIFACNDMMALGAAEVVDTAKKKAQIVILGVDATDDGKTAIKEGKMDGSIAQYPDQMGIMGVDKALEVINGGKIDENIPVPVKLLTKDDLK